MSSALEDRERRVIYAHGTFFCIGDIRVTSQTFSTRFDMEFKWKARSNEEVKRCEELHALSLKGEGAGKSMLWEFTLRFPNALRYQFVGRKEYLWAEATMATSANNDSVSSFAGDLQQGRADGAALVGMHVTIEGTFKCAQDLRDYPYDKQALQTVIQLGHEHHSARQLYLEDAVLKQDPERANLCFFQPDSEYAFRPCRFVEETTGPLETRDGRAISKFILVVPIERDHHSHNITVAMIMAINIMALFSFAIEKDAMYDRLELSMTLILVLVAFKYSIAESIPNVPYQTHLDQYLHTCYALLSVVFFSGGMLSWAERAYPNAIPTPVHLGAALICVGLLVAVNVNFHMESNKAIRRGAAKIGRMGKIDPTHVQLLLANGVELNEFGSVRDEHVALYRERMAFASTTYDMHGHLKKETVQARARELTQQQEAEDGDPDHPSSGANSAEKAASREDASRLSTTASVSASSEDICSGSIAEVADGEDNV